MDSTSKLQTVLEQAQHIERVSGNVTQGAGWGTVMASFFNEWAAAIGALIAATSLLINIYYKHKHYQLAMDRVQRGEHPGPHDV